jgi:hypothetical protein
MGIDLRARWRRRVAVVVTYAIFVILIELAVTLTDDRPVSGNSFLALLAMVCLTMTWRWLSVFRDNGVVKSFEGPPANTVGKNIIVGSLDEWARYRYGAIGFEQASEEQQHELLRTYRVGNYLVPAKSLEDYRLDERERAERDRISRWALIRLAGLLAITAGASAMARRPAPPFDEGSLFWSFALLALTLPHARVLWTEPDPHDAGDLKLAEGEA